MLLILNQFSEKIRSVSSHFFLFFKFCVFVFIPVFHFFIFSVFINICSEVVFLVFCHELGLVYFLPFVPIRAFCLFPFRNRWSRSLKLPFLDKKMVWDSRAVAKTHIFWHLWLLANFRLWETNWEPIPWPLLVLKNGHISFG